MFDREDQVIRIGDQRRQRFDGLATFVHKGRTG